MKFFAAGVLSLFLKKPKNSGNSDEIKENLAPSKHIMK